MSARADLRGNDTRPLRRGGVEVKRIYAAIFEEIVSGELPPGAKLSEPDLAKRFGISRGPLREAIRRLEERQLVSCTPNAGARVVIHSTEEIIETFIIRESLEGMAARLAAINMTADERIQLRKVFEEERERGRSAGYDRDFHMHIVHGSHNSRLRRIINRDYYQLLRLWYSRASWLCHGTEDSWREHQRILEAIEHRDAECAEILMRRHISRLREASIDNLKMLEAQQAAE
ncbi:GntR family transcriptional regulator [Bradyrhizobium sp. LHD-71]|uniref:GntR family transcriptional regulator n=1 Tax=Bradyrhizobium sp. LHD-71 TaxID=3072141 RepID=UPI00280C42E0|nr:GntR family transcriptional regulator [Bradyrhizobium sp. LHD-71]MDQ8729137.1 GntR family transcriptional regulator [Bradyrhizobium sp. LHD-71]